MKAVSAALLAASCALSSCAKIIAPYPKTWGSTIALDACGAIAGTWADQGQRISQASSGTKSLTTIFRMLSLMEAFDNDRGSLAEAGSGIRAVAISGAPRGTVQVTAFPTHGGRPRSDRFACSVTRGWAAIGNWENTSVGGGGGDSGLSLALPVVKTRTERLHFRKNAAGDLIARWLSRDRTYFAMVPFDSDTVRWLRFKSASAATPPATAPTPRNPR